jgi:hypothetical protein
MKRTRTRKMRSTVIGVVLVLGLTLAAAGSAGAGGLHFQHCGTLRGPGARFSILVHDARCPVARRVLTAVFAGKGQRRRDPASGKIDRVVDGWICGSAAGGFSCGKLGTNPETGPSISALAP